jgi:hypothetical protein
MHFFGENLFFSCVNFPFSFSFKKKKKRGKADAPKDFYHGIAAQLNYQKKKNFFFFFWWIFVSVAVQ